MTWVAGVDGCRAGWFRVARDPASGELRFDVVREARELLGAPPVARVVAIDVPIGLPARGPRPCDAAAREILGPRRSSVFPAPIRSALAARTRESASRITARADGRRVGVQAWGIYPKIREVDALLRADPRARRRLREAHPEVCFWAWNGRRPMQAPKRSPEGRRERLALVEAWLGPDLLRRARGGRPKRDLADDDVLDAVATLWTAHRILAGRALRLPRAPARDAVGLPMHIVF